MSLKNSNYSDFSAMTRGLKFIRADAQFGDDNARDFVQLHVADGNPVFIDSVSGQTRLVQISGQIEDIIDTPIIDSYATSWINEDGVLETRFFLRGVIGEVSFIWVGLFEPDYCDVEFQR